MLMQRPTCQLALCFVLPILTGTAACASDAKDPLAGLTVVSEDPSGAPLAGLDAMWQDRFDEGDLLFGKAYSEAEGLGPVFIRPACASCHGDDARGPGVVRKMVIVDENGLAIEDQSALPFGPTVRPQRAAGASEGITVPEDRDDVLVTVRAPPAVFGRGYMEAIAGSEIMRVAAAQAERTDAISGRINMVDYKSELNPDLRFHQHVRSEQVIGRFGLKAATATLDDFAAGALQGDMGITSPLRPEELPNPASDDDELPGEDIDADPINAMADYMRLLRIPTRGADAQSERGKKLFAKVGCDSCHVPTLHTRKDYPIAALADIDAPVYTDMLVHDMGRDFSDELADFSADGAEWRTAPLMGLRHLRNYLHDGRAKSIEDAITLHGNEDSEAHEVVAAFAKLSAADRAELLKFVSAL